MLRVDVQDVDQGQGGGVGIAAGEREVERLALNIVIASESVQPVDIALGTKPGHLALGVLTCSGLAFADGIVERPSDGVVAWLSAARLSFLQGTDPDPGSASVTSICGADAVPFHGFRAGGGQAQGFGVALDGCLYGPKHQTYEQELRKVLDSVRLEG